MIERLLATIDDSISELEFDGEMLAEIVASPLRAKIIPEILYTLSSSMPVEGGCQCPVALLRRITIPEISLAFPSSKGNFSMK